MADSALAANLTAFKEDQALLRNSVDSFFLIIISIIIFFMQGGFAFLEAGSVRSKNTVNILIKNILDCFIGGVSYWAIGWGLAYGPGGNPFCGGSQFFSYAMPYDLYPKWFFQFVFAATTATIVSGSVAERCQFGAYFTYSILLTACVYPPVSHWAWDSGDSEGYGQGWLNLLGYTDFAGSGVVHLLGGVCALVGCAFIGKRKGRFDLNGNAMEMSGHSVPLAALGGFILIFGFFAFNGGSQGSISNPGDGAIVGLAIVNTVLGACSGGLTVLFFNRLILNQTWSFLFTLNGALTGMVAQCAGCNSYEPWAALIIGVFGGLVYIGVHHLMLRLCLDDPLDAVAVHGGGGLLGVLCVPFFMVANLEVGSRGILWDGHLSAPWLTLGYNILGALVIALWSTLWSVMIFGTLYFFKLLRVSAELEQTGMDIQKHGEAAYPAQAWIEDQYRKRQQSMYDRKPVHMQGPGFETPNNNTSKADSENLELGFVSNEKQNNSGIDNSGFGLISSEQENNSGSDNSGFSH